MIAAFGALGYALSARALLLAAIVGAFVLGVEAMDRQTVAALIVLAIYGVSVVLPVAFLEIRKRQ